MNRLILNADQGTQKISRHIYGHFAEQLGRCIYDGLWVGEDSPIPNVRGFRSDIIEALKRVRVPVLRWPGGCYADDYHWMDGIGARDQRPVRVNQWWGGVPDSNAVGTHEFMDLCEQIGCEPYICGNVGSGTPQEMAQWVEYMTYPGGTEMSELRKQNGREAPWKIEYWGVGNENWGCGGNMDTKTYADLYRQFQTYLRDYSDNKLYKIAGGAGGVDFDGTSADILMENLKGWQKTFSAKAISLHYYAFFVNRPEITATDIDEAKWFEVVERAIQIDDAIAKHVAVMDFHDPDGKVELIVDEWGAWYPADEGTPSYELYQQNTMRDAVIAAATLHIFHKHARRVKMANLAQLVNVIQALILTEGEKMLLTPTYHVFEMFKAHQDATLLPLHVECDDYTFGDKSIPAITASASRGADGKILLTLCNVNPNADIALTLELRGMESASPTGRILTADSMSAYNSFDTPETVTPQPFSDFSIDGQTLTLTAPAKSVLALEL